jgi:hypothetical protein
LHHICIDLPTSKVGPIQSQHAANHERCTLQMEWNEAFAFVQCRKRLACGTDSVPPLLTDRLPAMLSVDETAGIATLMRKRNYANSSTYFECFVQR